MYRSSEYCCYITVCSGVQQRYVDMLSVTSSLVKTGDCDLTFIELNSLIVSGEIHKSALELIFRDFCRRI